MSFGRYLDLADYRRRVHGLYAEVRSVAEASPERAHVLWREGRDELFRSHPQSALGDEQRERFGGLPYFPYDPRFRFTAALDGNVGEEQLDFGLLNGDITVFRRCGVVHLPVGELEVLWLEAYGGGLFIPFRDGTSGQETYGGGRYLLDTVKGADLGARAGGELILDFNFAYHPSCHYDPRWVCPLAPRTNWLEPRIEAGERSDPA